MTIVCPKMHFSRLITTPFCWKRSNTCLTWLMCSCSFWLGINTLSMYAKTNGKSCNTWSIKIRCCRIYLWNVWTAFRKPNRTRGNSNKPKGVVINVLGICSGSTGIWWYARIRSSFVKIRLFWITAVMSCMCGTGYLSCLVTAFNAL